MVVSRDAKEWAPRPTPQPRRNIDRAGSTVERFDLQVQSQPYIQSANYSCDIPLQAGSTRPRIPAIIAP